MILTFNCNDPLSDYEFEIEPALNRAGSEDDDGSSDAEMPHNGLMSVLKEYQSGQNQKSEPKAAPKAAAKTRASASKASKGARPVAQVAQAMKTTVGTADGSKKRRRTEEVLSSEQNVSMGLGLDEMCEADKEICENFQERLAVLRNVKAPIPDAQFKSYVSDLLSKSNAFWSDLKTKRRSLARRSTNSDHVTNVLDGMEVDIKGHLHILKCNLHWIY